MKDLKVVFMGTPFFSVQILSALIQNTQVVLAVTAPDALVGRKKVLTACPVKELALSHKIEVFSPIKIRDDYTRIKELEPDIIITCAYGQIISEEILDIPRLGCVNIHASLLPKYRGGAPIHHALMNGDAETGITLMYMDKGMDSGDIITQESLIIEPGDNLETLSNKLSLLGTEMIIRELPSIINGTNQRIKQDSEKVVFSPIIKREHEKIDFNKSNATIINLIRALSPAPYPYFMLDGVPCKIVEAEKINANGKVGTITEVGKDYFIIMAANGGVKITKIKPFGKNIMTVNDFFNGTKKEGLIGKEVN